MRYETIDQADRKTITDSLKVSAGASPYGSPANDPRTTAAGVALREGPEYVSAVNRLRARLLAAGVSL